MDKSAPEYTSLRQCLVQGAVAGLAAGTALGLIAVLILVVIDLFITSPWTVLLGIVLVYAVLGLLVGLVLGLWRARREPVDHATPPPEPDTLDWSYLRRGLAQGLGAGLLAGACIALVEVLILVVVDRSWLPLTGLLYALIAYGLLGLLGGLVMGSLCGAWAAWRHRTAIWPAVLLLVATPGVFLVVHNQVRRVVLGIPTCYPSLAESLLVDNGLLIAAVVLGGGARFLLWRLPQHTWLRQPRWNAALYAILVLAAALVAGAPGFVATLTAQRFQSSIPPDLRDAPNVIFIMADTLRADRLGCYTQPSAGVDGDTSSLTPHIDALARDGVVYRETTSQAPWTRPSLATMLTSLYPTSHRATTRDSLLPDEVLTLPEILSAAGYRTAGFNPNGNVAPSLNFGQGFDEYGYLAPTIPFFAPPIAQRFVVFLTLYRLRDVLLYDSPTEYPHDERYQDAATVNQSALTWLERNRGSRFFLFLLYLEPHDPYFAHPYDGTSFSLVITKHPAPEQTPYMEQLYDGEVAYLDAHLGHLLDQLKAWGLYDDALIVFTADHGEEFYEHRGFGHGGTLYEEQLHVPLIVKYPGNAYAGTVDHEFARSLDIAPTVLDVVGTPIPEVFQGVSLHPRSTTPRPREFLAETDLDDHAARMVRVEHYKYIVAEEGNPRGLPPEALFDLHADPGEQMSLVSDQPDTVQRLRAALDQAIAYAQAHAVAAQTGDLDTATRERLRQLGY